MDEEDHDSKNDGGGESWCVPMFSVLHWSGMFTCGKTRQQTAIYYYIHTYQSRRRIIASEALIGDEKSIALQVSLIITVDIVREEDPYLCVDKNLKVTLAHVFFLYFLHLI